MFDYTKACQFGRNAAAIALQSGDVPRLLRELREAASDEGGYGAGYLTFVASVAIDAGLAR